MIKKTNIYLNNGKVIVLFLITILASLSLQRAFEISANTEFKDDFSSTTFDSMWTISEVDSVFSLTDDPGFFTMNVSSSEDTWTWSTSFHSPRLYQEAPNESWCIDTFIVGYPDIHAQTGLIFFEDVDNWLVWGYIQDTESDSHKTPGVGLEGVINGSGYEEQFFQNLTEAAWNSGVYLLIEFTYKSHKLNFYYRQELEANWELQGNIITEWTAMFFGLWGKSWDTNRGYSVKFDYFRCSPTIPGKLNLEIPTIVITFLITTLFSIYISKKKRKHR